MAYNLAISKVLGLFTEKIDRINAQVLSFCGMFAELRQATFLSVSLTILTCRRQRLCPSQ